MTCRTLRLVGYIACSQDPSLVLEVLHTKGPRALCWQSSRGSIIMTTERHCLMQTMSRSKQAVPQVIIGHGCFLTCLDHMQ